MPATVSVSIRRKAFWMCIPFVRARSKVSPVRIRASISEEAFYYPTEKPWPADALLERVEIEHGRKEMLGMDGDFFPWLIIFCVVALAAGFAFKGFFKVTI